MQEFINYNSYNVNKIILFFFIFKSDFWEASTQFLIYKATLYFKWFEEFSFYCKNALKSYNIKIFNMNWKEKKWKVEKIMSPFTRNHQWNLFTHLIPNVKDISYINRSCIRNVFFFFFLFSFCFFFFLYLLRRNMFINL